MNTLDKRLHGLWLDSLVPPEKRTPEFLVEVIRAAAVIGAEIEREECARIAEGPTFDIGAGRPSKAEAIRARSSR